MTATMTATSDKAPTYTSPPNSISSQAARTAQEEQERREQALNATLEVLDGLQNYTIAALEEHGMLLVDVPPQLSALPDAIAKVGLALHNLQDVITTCRDVATRGNPVGYGFPVAPPLPPMSVPTFQETQDAQEQKDKEAEVQKANETPSPPAPVPDPAHEGH